MAAIDGVVAPSEKLLKQFTKGQLLRLAAYYEVETTSSEKCLIEACTSTSTWTKSTISNVRCCHCVKAERSELAKVAAGG